MRVFVFLEIMLLINVGLALVVQNRNYKWRQLLPIWSLAIILPINAGFGQWTFWNAPPKLALLGIQITLTLNIFAHLFLVELVNNLFRDISATTSINVGRWKFSARLIWRAGALMVVGICFMPGVIEVYEEQGRRVVVILQRTISVFQLIMAIFALYVLENTYRFAEDYQRKIGRLCFLSVGILMIYQTFFYSRILLYGFIRPQYMDTASVVYGMTYPVILIGFLRYRLAVEKVSIPRDAIYTSATLFLTGAAFLGVALTAFVFRWFQLDFSYFEHFLLVFSFSFFILLVVGSGRMRRQVTRCVNDIFYSRRYDYHEQFFQLHKTIISGTDLAGVVTELVENMKYSVTVDDAFVFFLNRQDGNFYMQKNKEHATIPDLILGGDEQLVKILEEEKTPINLLDRSILASETSKKLAEMPIIKTLKIDAVFPILNRRHLLGVLGLRGGRTHEFDEEDFELINVFTNSLGDVLFKNQVVTERIEQKQFESFNHVASFIIHDIKNQIATLSLIVQNAEKNLRDPSFQESMLSSVRNCAGHLQSLIHKLTVAPKQQEIVLDFQDVVKVINEVIEGSGIKALEDVKLTIDAEPKVRGYMDRRSLYFILKNLIQNALDAMRNRGNLLITVGTLVHVPEGLAIFYRSGTKFFSSYSCYIIVEDNGPGMSNEYVKDKLFRPFSTTKEKGIGIGLYQCKSLAEKMGGKILCYSKLDEGTKFCVLLK